MFSLEKKTWYIGHINAETQKLIEMLNTMETTDDDALSDLRIRTATAQAVLNILYEDIDI